MGWKNVKEHYRIEHIVHVREGDVCIGSPYIPVILRIDREGTAKYYSEYSSPRGELARYKTEIEADRSKVLELIATPDTFARDIVVYTYEMARIIEKRCEKFGWPNVTHDGELMYENTFSTNRKNIIERALCNARAGAELIRERVNSAEHELEKARCYLAEYEDAVKTLTEAAA